MALESGNFLAALDPNNPAPNDAKSKGDDHLRLLKKALRDSFVGFTGAVLAGGTDVGTSNTYILNPATNLPAYSKNLVVFWLPSSTNGGASTINISGLGAVPIRRIDGTTLENGDIANGEPVAMLYTGTEFRMVTVTKQYVASLVFNGVLPSQTGNAGKPLITNGTTASFSNAFGVAMDEAKGANIAASSTVNLTSAAGTGNYLHITGSASINAFTLPAGAARDICFDGVNTLVNSGSLVLPTGANIATAPGDTCRVRGEGSGVTRVVDYQRATGRPLVEYPSPGLYLLATLTTTPATVVDLLNVFSSTYDDYVVQIDGISVPTAGESSDWRVQLQVAQGGVVDAANNYSAALVNTSGSTGAGSSLLAAVGLVVGSRAWVSINFSGVNRTDFHGIRSESYVSAAGASSNASALSGAHSGNAALSGFRLTMVNVGGGGSPAFGAGATIRVYGVKKA